MHRVLLAPIVAIALAATSCGSDESSELQVPDYWPTAGWRSDAPANHGFDAGALGELAALAEAELPFLDSLIVVRNGYLVYEQYFNGHDADTIHNIASVTKSWTSAAVGAVREREGAPDLDARLADLLPGYFDGGRHADKAEITLRHLLEMRSGIDYSEETLDSGGYGTGEDLAAKDLTAFALDFTIAHPPGDAWNYSTLDTQLISAVMHRVTGESLESLVRSALFEPMGVTSYTWFADAAGTTIGGQQLSMTPRDMAKLGLLYLQGGTWDGVQLVPARWVEVSVGPQGRRAFFPPTGQTEAITWYGYHWWTWGSEWFRGYGAFQAKGFAGQQVLVLPKLQLIVVTTASLDGVTQETSAMQERAIYDFLLERVFPALKDADWEDAD